MIKKEKHIKDISNSLAILQTSVQFQNSVNYYDCNISSEDFFKDFLNLIYNLNLINLNTEEKNQDSIDLGDKTASIAFQITSSNTSKKIKDTIEKFITNAHYNTYKKLNILIINDKKKYRSLFDTKNLFKLEILDIKDLIRILTSKDVHSLSKISNFINENFQISNKNPTIAKEVDAIACLVGSWDENNKADKEIISQLAEKNYKDWIQNLRELLDQKDSPLTLNNGIWKIKKRKELWNSIGSRIFDNHLDSFQKCAVSILRESDPKFELPEDERIAATIYGKNLKHSSSIREGISEGLALLGSQPEALTNCSDNKAEIISVLSIREILENSDWVRWASLDRLLPLFAEAAPSEFLKAVENTLHKTPNLFIEIFPKKHHDALFGGPYHTGLLWALEILAWDESLLVRVSCILGHLASIDSDEHNIGNRPINSLLEIFLPRHPQTTASIEKRKVAIETLNKECPDITWELLTNLLPQKKHSAAGTYKPLFRNYSQKDWSEKVTQAEYWELTSFYADFLVEQAKDNIAKLTQLIFDLDHLPQTIFDKLLSYLSSEAILSEPESSKLELWNPLISFIYEHEPFSDGPWALDSTQISKIKDVASKLQPKKQIYLYHRLFNNENYELYTKNEDWSIQDQEIDKQRKNAVKLILKDGGINEIFKLVEIIKFPSILANTLGRIEENFIDEKIIPELLIHDNKQYIEFIKCYIWDKYAQQNEEWLNKIDFQDWTLNEQTLFFVSLPFIRDIWNRVTSISTELETEYWKNITVNPFQQNANLDFAIDKLIKHNRALTALDCLYRLIHFKQPVDISKVIKALKHAPSSQESKKTMDKYHIVEIIKFLQNNDQVKIEDLLEIEFIYLPFFNAHLGTRPKTLEYQLANDSKFFCKVISIVYRSKNGANNEENLDKNIISRYGDLLYDWKTPPGSQEDGSFDDKKFTIWLNEVKQSCTNSGHLEVALSTIGKVLFYSPTDPDGFWINKTVAEELNKIDVAEMRRGFSSGIIKSRGVHFVDPKAKPEKELVEEYKQKAEKTENAGYHRLAIELKEVANTYKKVAERIIKEYKMEDTI